MTRFIANMQMDYSAEGDMDARLKLLHIVEGMYAVAEEQDIECSFTHWYPMAQPDPTPPEPEPAAEPETLFDEETA